LDVDLQIDGTLFAQGKAISGGAIYVSGDSSINISNS